MTRVDLPSFTVFDLTPRDQFVELGAPDADHASGVVDPDANWFNRR
jgi:hypothetical protein